MKSSSTRNTALAVALLGLASFCSCSTAKSTGDDASQLEKLTSKPQTSSQEQEAMGALFIAFKLEREDEKSIPTSGIKFSKFKEVEVKDDRRGALDSSIGIVGIVMSADNGQETLRVVEFPSPLEGAIEFVNEEGELGRKYIVKKSTEAVYRVSCPSTANWVKVYWKQDGAETALFESPISRN